MLLQILTRARLKLSGNVSLRAVVVLLNYQELSTYFSILYITLN